MEESDDINKDVIKTTLINEKENIDEENKEEENKENIINDNEKMLINEDNKEYNIIIPKKEEIIQENININNNQNQIQQNQEILEHIITIKYSKILKIPYFIFGNIFHFYFPFKRFPSEQIRLSEMPTPPFAVVRKECK